ncbi:PAS domain S-box protein [Paenibacillus sp.]|uniref:PAS domain S-box protein n=1 Tax=Paenibacillus sp. TaxID=58172 RepID=UPI002812130D|nr:PAS domain S-box protein [Paenibacillus sp.]
MDSRRKGPGKKRTSGGEIGFTNRQYKQLVEFSPEPILVYSNEIVVYTNAAGAEMIGAPNAEAAIGRRLADFLRSPDVGQSIMEPVGPPFEFGKPTDIMEKKWVRRDGSVVTAEVRAVPIQYKGEQAVQLLCRDITERKKAEVSLRESELRYRQLLKSVPEAIFVHSEGIIVYANDAGIRLLRARGPEQVVGRSILDFIHPDFHHKTSDRFIASGQSIRGLELVTLSFIRCDGDVFEGEASSGETFSLLDRKVYQTTIRDITERIRREQSLRKSEKLSVIGQMAAGVAHEIRNPLTALIGFNQLLREKFVGNQAYCAIMETELKRINYIVNEFMQLAKPVPSEYRRHRLETLFDALFPLVQSHAALNDVTLHLEWDDDIPEIRCDDNQLKQVFLNVMKNAIEAMPNGGNLRVAVGKEARHVAIRFADEGPGIDEQALGKLGDPFYTTKEQGTGLGLMICHKIIQEHGGEMKFESKIGNGTIVTIRLPF